MEDLKAKYERKDRTHKRITQGGILGAAMVVGAVLNQGLQPSDVSHAKCVRAFDYNNEVPTMCCSEKEFPIYKEDMVKVLWDEKIIVVDRHPGNDVREEYPCTEVKPRDIEEGLRHDREFKEPEQNNQ